MRSTRLDEGTAPLGGVGDQQGEDVVAGVPQPALLAPPEDEQAPPAEGPPGFTGGGGGAGVGCGVQGSSSLTGEPRPAARTGVRRQSDSDGIQRGVRNSPTVGPAVQRTCSVLSVADVPGQQLPPDVLVT